MMDLLIEKPVLILDDDKDFCEEISTFLAGYHVPVIVTHKPSEAEEVLSDEDISMMLLDVMLPEKHGFQFCKETRARMADLPILFVSAYCDSFEQVLGFEAGADHFLSKPFLPQELLARMKAISRRTGSIDNDDALTAGKIHTKAGLTIDLSLGRAFLNGKKLKLTSFQFELLVYFVQNPQRLISRSEVMTSVNSYNIEIPSRSVDIHVSRLRKALRDSAEEPRFIRTIRGKGYYFIDEVYKRAENTEDA